jgi:mandelamide amidase
LQDTPKLGGTLKVGVQADPTALDPQKQSLTAIWHVIEQIYDGLGPQIHEGWSRAVVPSAPGHVSDEKYQAALNGRAELRRRLASSAFAGADALLFPTTPCAAPRIDSQWKFEVGGKAVTDVFLARHTHPSSCAGLPGISLPMALNARGLPLGLELDAAPGRDRELLALARRVERVLGRLPAPVAL